MAIFNSKKDMSSEGDGVVDWGPPTLAIFNKKQDMPSKDGDGHLGRKQPSGRCLPSAINTFFTSSTHKLLFFDFS